MPRFRSLLKSTDGGATWSPVGATAASVHTNVGGPGGPTWWQSISLLGGGGYVAAQIVIDPPNTSHSGEVVYVAGRGGVWASFDGGSNWYPMVAGLEATINRAVAAAGKTPETVYAANTDWVLFRSSDGLIVRSQ